MGVVLSVVVVASVVIALLVYNLFTNRDENKSFKQNMSTEDPRTTDENTNKQIDTTDTEYPTTTTNNSDLNKVYLKAVVNNEDWNGITQYGGSQFYPNGNKILGVDSPFLILAFGEVRGKEKPESIMITIKEFKPGLGKYSGILEVLYSRKNFTNAYQDDLPEQKTDFTLEFTKWDEKNAKTVIMSAKFRGTLKGIFGPDVIIENGEIIDLPIQVVYEGN